MKKETQEGGLWTNIHKKRKRIKNGSGEKMNKPGSKDAPTDKDFKDASEGIVRFKTFIEAMSPKEKAAHAKAIADFKKKGGKVKKLKPGYAQGWTGKDDLGSGQKGMLDKSDTKGFGTSKKIGSMKK